MHTPDRLLTKAEAAKLAGIHPRTLRRHEIAGRITFQTGADGVPRIAEAALRNAAILRLGKAMRAHLVAYETARLAPGNHCRTVFGMNAGRDSA